MEKISYVDIITNEEVLRRVGVHRHLMNMLGNRKKSWIGPVLRGKGLLIEVIEGKMVGKMVKEDQELECWMM